jgi:L-aspartate oxidase
VEHQFDILVIGSGIAGLSFALKAAEHGSVAVITKKDKLETNTNYAQGGIASVLGVDDAFETHVADTLQCGAGLCDEQVVELVVRSGPALIDELSRLGVGFSRDTGASAPYALGREGGHSRNRIVHARDSTGRSVERALVERAEAHPRIQLVENHLALDLIVEDHALRAGSRDLRRAQTCLGAYVLDGQSREVHLFGAFVTALCTGGAGKVYLYTSNPDIAVGDGLAMAWRAGVPLANLEFVQFHPTCLFHPRAKNFLISEAVRGEGGRLIDRRGRAFMAQHHPLGDLAFRDVVARAIDAELKASGDACVFVDITHRDDDFIRERFPNIHARCLSLGIDITREPIPVVPAAHYFCGGIVSGTSAETETAGLYAIGECACTGLHGANRLASNSLLEALVFADRAASHCGARLAELRRLPPAEIPPFSGRWGEEDRPRTEMIFISHNWDVIRRLMWNYVGIVRTDRRLQLARTHLAQIRLELDEHMPRIPIGSDAVELRNLALVAELVVRCAQRRRESRGLHYNLDCPQPDPRLLENTIIRRGNG